MIRWATGADRSGALEPVLDETATAISASFTGRRPRTTAWIAVADRNLLLLHPRGLLEANHLGRARLASNTDTAKPGPGSPSHPALRRRPPSRAAHGRCWGEIGTSLRTRAGILDHLPVPSLEAPAPAEAGALPPVGDRRVGNRELERGVEDVSLTDRGRRPSPRIPGHPKCAASSTRCSESDLAPRGGARCRSALRGQGLHVVPMR